MVTSCHGNTFSNTISGFMGNILSIKLCFSLKWTWFFMSQINTKRRPYPKRRVNRFCNDISWSMNGVFFQIRSFVPVALCTHRCHPQFISSASQGWSNVHFHWQISNDTAQKEMVLDSLIFIIGLWLHASVMKLYLLYLYQNWFYFSTWSLCNACYRFPHAL